MKATLSKIIHTETDYIHLALRMTLVVLIVGLILYAVFPIGFWVIFGEDATSNHISQLSVLGLIYLYGPLVMILTFIAWRYFANKKKSDIQRLKSYLIVGVIILILYPFRYEILEDTVEWVVKLID